MLAERRGEKNQRGILGAQRFSPSDAAKKTQRGTLGAPNALSAFDVLIVGRFSAKQRSTRSDAKRRGAFDALNAYSSISPDGATRRKNRSSPSGEKNARPERFGAFEPLLAGRRQAVNAQNNARRETQRSDSTRSTPQTLARRASPGGAAQNNARRETPRNDSARLTPPTLTRRATTDGQRAKQRSTRNAAKRFGAFDAPNACSPSNDERFSAKQRSTRNAAKRFGAFDASNACSSSGPDGSAKKLNAERSARQTLCRLSTFSSSGGSAKNNARREATRRVRRP